MGTILMVVGVGLTVSAIERLAGDSWQKAFGLGVLLMPPAVFGWTFLGSLLNSLSADKALLVAAATALTAAALMLTCLAGALVGRGLLALGDWLFDKR